MDFMEGHLVLHYCPSLAMMQMTQLKADLQSAVVCWLKLSFELKAFTRKEECGYFLCRRHAFTFQIEAPVFGFVCR